MNTNPSGGPRRLDWSDYWKGLGFALRTTAGLRSWFRRHVTARAVAAVVNGHFAAEGTFIHAGCGTGETDLRIEKKGKKIIALDFVREALLVARRRQDSYMCVMGDIRRLPFIDDSVDGIWNVGVHEHFSPAENAEILAGFYRVLRPGGIMLILWPAKYTVFMFIKAAVEGCIKIWSESFAFFPDEINKGRSCSHVKEELENSGFRVISVTMSPLDWYIYISAVAEKPQTR